MILDDNLRRLKFSETDAADLLAVRLPKPYSVPEDLSNRTAACIPSSIIRSSTDLQKENSPIRYCTGERFYFSSGEINVLQPQSC